MERSVEAREMGEQETIGPWIWSAERKSVLSSVSSATKTVSYVLKAGTSYAAPIFVCLTRYVLDNEPNILTAMLVRNVPISLIIS